MFGFHSKKPRIGLDLTSTEIRITALTGMGRGTAVHAAETAALPAGVVCDQFSSPAIADPEGLAGILRDILERPALLPFRRVGVSLPDSLFRVQSFDFDELPAGREDRERLVRWRYEKAAAFDTSDTVLRYQALQRPKGVTLLTCLAKRETIERCEDVLFGLGREPWAIGPSSFHGLNFYYPAISQKTPVFAIAFVARKAFTAMVVENGGPQFYRFKEIKTVNAGDVRERLLRELDDSLHFYMHQDHARSEALLHLYLAGERRVLEDLASAMNDGTSLAIETLSPSSAATVRRGEIQGDAWAENMAAALGAGGAVC